jgi:hypothetical protein
VADLRKRGIYAGYPNRYHCIFIHIPKTGGSSVAHSLFGTNSRHVPYYEYQHVSPAKFRRFFKFAFVRNPWDRIVSTYLFLQRGGMNDQDRVWGDANLRFYADFASFVRGWVNEDNVRSWVHFVPQADFILDDADRLMVDFLGRFERLGDDFRQVADRLGCDAQLPKINATGREHFTSYYDEESYAIVRRVYARDIAAFGYEFEPTGPRGGLSEDAPS